MRAFIEIILISVGFASVLACSDELSEDTKLDIVVKGFSKDVVGRSAWNDQTETPESVNLQLAQVILTDENGLKKSLLKSRQEKSFNIIERDTRMFSKKLEDAFVNANYQSIGIFFTYSNGAFECVDNSQKTIDATLSSDDGFDANSCEIGANICFTSVESFSPQILGVGIQYEKAFRIKKAESRKIYVQLNWKNIINKNKDQCRFPDFEVNLK